jgi:DNA-directed RNA polymerase subunit M/transcription elongation factor TFIIS
VSNEKTDKRSVKEKKDAVLGRACEKCWSDAYSRMLADPSKAQTDHYYDLLEERKDNPCKTMKLIRCPKCGNRNRIMISEIIMGPGQCWEQFDGIVEAVGHDDGVGDSMGFSAVCHKCNYRWKLRGWKGYE